jgi:hypothetical protein
LHRFYEERELRYGMNRQDYAKYACKKAARVRTQRATTRYSDDVFGAENMANLNVCK